MRPISYPQSSCGRSFFVLLMICFLVMFSGWAYGQQTTSTTQALSPMPHLDELSLDEYSVDIQEMYADAVSSMLKHERFEDLEKLASSLRKGPGNTFPGGLPKLPMYYDGLSYPFPSGHSTQVDWTEHFRRLRKWMVAHPKSITAHIALASSYLNLGWDARGSGMADSVSDSGMQIFAANAAKAGTVLEKASHLSANCPEWYLVMMGVYLAQGASKSEETALFEKAVASDPHFYSYYRAHAIYLESKWYGETGESVRFAQQIADKVSGDEGDIIYFEIARLLDDAEEGLPEMSWPRIQRGFAAIQKKYGNSPLRFNQFAHLAYRFNDVVRVHDALHEIGDDWSKKIWHTQRFFEAAKSWADAYYEHAAWAEKTDAEALANNQTEEGKKYKQQLDAIFAKSIRECIDSGAGEAGSFNLWLELGEKGEKQNFRIEAKNRLAGCLLKKVAGQMAFPAPPRDHYWIREEIDGGAPNPILE